MAPKRTSNPSVMCNMCITLSAYMQSMDACSFQSCRYAHIVEMGLQRNAVLSLWIAALSLLAVAAMSTAPSNTFVEVRPKLWRYNGEFAFLPSPAARTPVAVWLIEVKSSWILIDTGAASPEYREPFLEALKNQLNSFKNPLRLVLRKSTSAVFSCKSFFLLSASAPVLLHLLPDSTPAVHVLKQL